MVLVGIECELMCLSPWFPTGGTALGGCGTFRGHELAVRVVSLGAGD